jgi:predicted aspartyl protease
MTDHFDFLKQIQSKGDVIHSEPLRQGYKTCPLCFKEILENAVKCKYCKNWLIQNNKGSSSLSLKSLLSLNNKKLLYSFIGLFGFYLLINFSIFCRYSAQNWGYNLGFLFGNATSLIFTYLGIIFALFILLKLFRTQGTERNVSRAQVSAILVSILVFYMQSYNLAKNERQRVLSSSSYSSANKPVPEYDPSSPSVLGIATSNLGVESIPENYHGEPVRIPIQIQGNHNLIQASVLSQQAYSGQFMLDTGAAQTVIYRRFLKRHNLVVPSNSQIVQFHGFAGQANAPVVFVDLNLGGVVLRNVVAVVIDDPQLFPGDGVIGMNALKHFKFELDQTNQTLTLKQ